MGRSAAGGRRWRSERERVLVCLDLQRVSAPDGEADRCVRNCGRMLAHARRGGWRVVHVHSRKEAPEGRPIEGLEPLVSEPVIYRGGVSAFSSGAFRRLVTGLTCELVIIGYSMSSSCLATAMVAYDHGLPVTLVQDAVSASPVDAMMREALEVVSRQIASPFVSLASTADLLGQTRLLRVV
jgi:nicotinamidase-related amidase